MDQMYGGIEDMCPEERLPTEYVEWLRRMSAGATDADVMSWLRMKNNGGIIEKIEDEETTQYDYFLEMILGDGELSEDEYNSLLDELLG